MKSNTKFILVHPYNLQKAATAGSSSSSPSNNRLWLLALVSFFTLAFLVTLIYTRDPAAVTSKATAAAAPKLMTAEPLPAAVVSTLLHYASKSNDSYHMSHGDLKMISEVLRKCVAPCNLLVFGLTHETLLWKALNHNGRTIFIDENRYYAAYVEEQHPEIEAFDVQYTTKVSEMKDLISSTKHQIRNECRPVQNLLFSDCKLGINDLPNLVYELDWDVILVDGPRGDWADAPGRMSAIFTAGVLARTKKAGGRSTHVLLHDYYRDVERICSREFLCRENLVDSNDMVAHFVIEKAHPDTFHFCTNTTTTSTV